VPKLIPARTLPNFDAADPTLVITLQAGLLTVTRQVLSEIGPASLPETCSYVIADLAPADKAALDALVVKLLAAASAQWGYTP
jgi:hypothetical protein